MLRFETTSRKAFLLYGALLVLPTLIFGLLYWTALQRDFQREREAVPERALHGAERIVGRMREHFAALLESEERRPFYHYSDVISPPDALGDDLALQPSAMIKGPMPTGILGWFSIDRSRGSDNGIHIYLGSDVLDRERTREHFERVVQEFRRLKASESYADKFGDYVTLVDVEVPLTALAVCLNADQVECVRRVAPSLRGRNLKVGVSEFRLQFYRQDGAPHAIASRRVRLSNPVSRSELPADAPCVEPLATGFDLHQGFLLDVEWLFQRLPLGLADQVLDEDEELRLTPQAGPMDYIGSEFANIFPVIELGFEPYYPEDGRYGQLDVLAFTERLEQRHARQSRAFLATGFMLLLTLGMGMTLLYRSVRRELDQAHRMQNFVAAVTHELRTPISTIRLHAEMLLDGWVDGAKQPEYYQRIVRETHRLSTLVERVLEKSRLKENITRPVPGDLNEHVAALQEDLLPVEGEPRDLAFQLEPKLPQVWLTAEAVGMIVANLVENARKYAPARDEPILVRTRWENGRVLLEVLDRGPGVPAAERERIFEAFYRVGSEQTRTTTGTGLGLHLVRLHAETCRADASVVDRPGGGSIFRVAFLPAD